MTTPFFNNVPFPKITLGKVQSLNGIYRQEVTTGYSETVRAMNLELLNKTDEDILEYLIPRIQGTLLRAGWTAPPTPTTPTFLDN